jgi:hypothetical protein
MKKINKPDWFELLKRRTRGNLTVWASQVSFGSPKEAMRYIEDLEQTFHLTSEAKTLLLGRVNKAPPPVAPVDVPAPEEAVAPAKPPRPKRKSKKP